MSNRYLLKVYPNPSGDPFCHYKKLLPVKTNLIQAKNEAEKIQSMVYFKSKIYIYRVFTDGREKFVFGIH